MCTSSGAAARAWSAAAALPDAGLHPAGRRLHGRRRRRGDWATAARRRAARASVRRAAVGHQPQVLPPAGAHHHRPAGADAPTASSAAAQCSASTARASAGATAKRCLRNIDCCGLMLCDRPTGAVMGTCRCQMRPVRSAAPAATTAARASPAPAAPAGGRAPSAPPPLLSLVSARCGGLHAAGMVRAHDASESRARGGDPGAAGPADGLSAIEEAHRPATATTPARTTAAPIGDAAGASPVIALPNPRWRRATAPPSAGAGRRLARGRRRRGGRRGRRARRATRRWWRWSTRAPSRRPRGGRRPGRYDNHWAGAPGLQRPPAPARASARLEPAALTAPRAVRRRAMPPPLPAAAHRPRGPPFAAAYGRLFGRWQPTRRAAPRRAGRTDRPRSFCASGSLVSITIAPAPPSRPPRCAATPVPDAARGAPGAGGPCRKALKAAQHRRREPELSRNSASLAALGEGRRHGHRLNALAGGDVRESTLTPLLDKLEGGAHPCARDPSDRRVQRLFITKKRGRKAPAQVEAGRVAHRLGDRRAAGARCSSTTWVLRAVLAAEEVRRPPALPGPRPEGPQPAHATGRRRRRTRTRPRRGPVVPTPRCDRGCSGRSRSPSACVAKPGRRATGAPLPA